MKIKVAHNPQLAAVIMFSTVFKLRGADLLFFSRRENNVFFMAGKQCFFHGGKTMFFSRRENNVFLTAGNQCFFCFFHGVKTMFSFHGGKTMFLFTVGTFFFFRRQENNVFCLKSSTIEVLWTPDTFYF
jgi:hypothetical protein